MKLLRLFLISFILLNSSILGLCSQTLNFINTEYVGDEQVDLLVYAGNGTFLGTLNTSSPLEIDSDAGTDLVIYQRTQQVNLATHPEAWLEWVLKGGAIGLFVFLIVIVGVLVVFMKIKKKYG